MTIVLVVFMSRLPLLVGCCRVRCLYGWCDCAYCWIHFCYSRYSCMRCGWCCGLRYRRCCRCCRHLLHCRCCVCVAGDGVDIASVVMVVVGDMMVVACCYCCRHCCCCYLYCYRCCCFACCRCHIAAIAVYCCWYQRLCSYFRGCRWRRWRC